MKPTKPADLRQLTDNELQDQIQRSEDALTNMRFRKAVGQLEEPSTIRIIRRDIARLKTIQRERQLAAKG